MICKNCGNEINENAKFCPKCGAPVAQETDATSTPDYGAGVKENEGGTTTVNPQKKRRIWIPIVIIVVVVVIVLIVLAATGVLTKKTVKLDDYVNVEFAGYEGHGTAEVSLDLYKLGEDYDGKIKLSEEANTWGYYNFSEIVEDIADVSVDPSSDLSNGDEVTVNWIVDQSYFDMMVASKVKLSYEPETVEVTDLEPIDSVDVFEGISVEFSGISPDASADFSFDANAAGVSEDAAHYLHFSLDKMEGLAIGDTVTVTLDESSAEELAQEFGVYPAEMSKDYEVEGIPYYVSSLDQIPEDAMEQMKQQAEDEQVAQYAKWDDEDYLMSMDYLGCYFLYEKPGISLDEVNIVYQIYKVNARRVELDKDNNEATMDLSYYWYCGFYNGEVLADGTFTMDYSNYTASKDEFFTDGFDSSTGTWTRSNVLRYYGFEDLDSMFNNIVTARLSEYTYESTVEDQ